MFIMSPERVFICKGGLKRKKSESFITLKEIKEDIKLDGILGSKIRLINIIHMTIPLCLQSPYGI